MTSNAETPTRFIDLTGDLSAPLTQAYLMSSRRDPDAFFRAAFAEGLLRDPCADGAPLFAGQPGECIADIDGGFWRWRAWQNAYGDTWGGFWQYTETPPLAD